MEQRVYPPGIGNLPGGTYVEVTIHGKELEDAQIIEIKDGDILPPTKGIGRGWLRIED